MDAKEKFRVVEERELPVVHHSLEIVNLGFCVRLFGVR